MHQIEHVGHNAIVSGDKMAFTYESGETPRELKEQHHRDSFNWTQAQDFIGDYVIYPYGDRNDLPEQIKEAVFNNTLAPGILTKKAQLLWGSGPKLYKERFDKGALIKDWQDNTTIQAWLDTWDYEDYVLSCANDFQYIQGNYSKMVQSKGTRIGNNFIHSLEYVQPNKARLASLRSANSPKATHVIVNDWSFSGPHSMEYKAYDIFDFRSPFKSRNSILYSNLKSFCTDYYTIPDLYGSMEWLRRSTAVPLILKAFSKHSLHYKFHIESPAGYWEAKKKLIEENCRKAGKEYNNAMLQELQEDTLRAISEVLSGEVNAGKYLHTIKTLRYDGANLIEEGWTIKFIDQKAKDFIDSQIAIADRADRALSSGIGLHGALGNLSDKGESGSGSEQLYALKNYMATGIDIPQMIVLKALNYALKANFPKLGLKMGFYHIQPEKEQDVNPENRLKNNV